MKKILFAALICIIALSCEEKSKYAIEREQKEAELKQIRDSLSNEDIKLSFMGIAIGGDVCQIDSAVNLGKIKIDSCSNGTYIGSTLVPCIKDTTKFNAEALVRIGTLDNKVVAIELLFEKPYQVHHVFDFIKNTFNERYYDKDEEWRASSSINYPKSYTWSFKNQSVCVEQVTHKDIREVVVGTEKGTGKNIWEPREVDVLHAVCVEYHQDSLFDKLKNMANRENVIKDSVDRAEKAKADQERRLKAEQAEKVFRDNI